MTKGTLDFEHLVAVVHGTGDTLFAFDKQVYSALFDIIDNALGSSGRASQCGDESLTKEEIETGLKDQKVINFIMRSKSPALMRLLSSKEKDRDKSFRKIDEDGSGTITKDEWVQFMQGVYPGGGCVKRASEPTNQPTNEQIPHRSVRIATQPTSNPTQANHT